jgi:hypothetical protein
MGNPDQIEQLTDALTGVREELVEAVVAEEWANPYWADRYGERGLLYIRQDCQYHVETLISTILIDQAVFMTKHYKWLQGVLVHRGLCSRHLYESIAAFDSHIARRLPHLWLLIQPYQAAAYDGLAYASPVCQALAQHEEELAVRVTRRLWDENPEWKMRLGAQGEALYLRENRYYLSYLQDALGWQEPELFSGYLTWFSSYKEARRMVPQMQHQSLSRLADELPRLLPEPEAASAINLINASLASI